MNSKSDDELAVRQAKISALKVAFKSSEGHLASSFSVMDILYVLYKYLIIPNGETNSFILSKGHASLGFYAVLCELGLIQEQTLDTFCEFDSALGGHPDRNKLKCAVASTGSLGHGVPQAVGIALARKIKNLPGRVFVLVGDGELNEGSVWEGLLIASHHKLNNLTIIVDANRSSNRAVEMGDISIKLSAFGLNCATVDGHNHTDLLAALQQTSDGPPIGIISNTVKGKGVVDMENNPAWHHAAPTLDQLDSFIKELR